MNNKQILQKVIEKAVENGWTFLPVPVEVGKIEPFWVGDKWKVKVYSSGETDSYMSTFSLNDIIFSHDFAKAFWGEERRGKRIPDCAYIGTKKSIVPRDGNKPCRACGTKGFDNMCPPKEYYEPLEEYQTIRGYRYHLQQLAVAEDRLAYLKEFV